jgi:hypothetical protein
MHLLFKRFLTVFSWLLLVSANVFACEWGTTYEDVRYIIFNPNIINNQAWQNFYYTTHLYFVPNHVSEKDERTLAAEWKKKLKLDASEDELYAYLFQSATKDPNPYTALKAELKKNKPWGDFVDFAKKCESAISTNDPWISIQTDSLVLSRKKLINQGTNILQNQTDVFWKKKYAFQLLRLAYYNADFVLFNRLFGSYFNFRNYTSPMDMWAANYKSMVLEHAGEVDSANFIHAMVFCNSSNKMLVSHQWYTTRNFEAQLKMAKTKEEASNLYMLKALKQYGNALDDIVQAYTLHPFHSLLPLALSREMNKVEDVYGTYQINTNWSEEWGFLNNADSSYLRINKILYIHRFYEEVKKMETIKKTNPDFYYLLLTNLAIMNRDISVAKTSLTQVNENDSALIFQKKMLGIILHIVTTDITTDASQNFIGTELDYLIRVKSSQFDSQRMLHSLFRYIQQALEQKKQFHKARLISYIAREKLCNSCYTGSANYSVIAESDDLHSDPVVLQIIDLFHKPTKNNLEKILLSPYPHEYYFWELLGTIYLRQNKLEKSREAFHKIPKDVWAFTFDVQENLALNPFIPSFLKKYPAEYRYWDKAALVDTLYQLTIKKEKTAHDYQCLGNVWYNFSSMGNCWYMLHYAQTGSFSFHDDWGKKFYPLTYQINLLALNNSISNYKTALQLSKNPEEKAEIVYMLAYCYYIMNKKADYITWAAQYEQMKTTNFYQGEKCTITPLYNIPQQINRFFSQSTGN